MSALAGEKDFDVVVVGAGAAGQLAAVAAGEAGRRVVVLEQMPRAGMKLTASGGGRANVTNMVSPSAMAAAFGRQGRFTGAALDVLGPKALRQRLGRWGVPTVVDEASRVYPASQRAADVQAALQRRLVQLGVQVRLNCTVNRLWLEAGRLRGVEDADGNRIAAGRTVLACGGRSWPALGGTGGGYDLARQGGHTIAAPTPALVPLVTREHWSARLAGVALRGARVWIALPKQSKTGVTGDVLFTHRGLSGPAVLDISGAVARLLRPSRPVPLRIELAAGMNAAAWARQMAAWRTASGRRRVTTCLTERVPASLGQLLCEWADVTETTTTAQLPAAGARALAALLAGLEVTVTGTEGFGTAFVTRGGVTLAEVDPATLESRRLPGLYLAGELLDLDGPTGGFNLQWAFASGWLAGAGRSG